MQIYMYIAPDNTIETTSAIGCDHIIPLIPKNFVPKYIAGTNTIPCLHTYKIKEGNAFPNA